MHGVVELGGGVVEKKLIMYYSLLTEKVGQWKRKIKYFQNYTEPNVKYHYYGNIERRKNNSCISELNSEFNFK